MARFPFIYRLQEAVAGNAAHAFTLNIDSDETVEIHQILAKSTAGFNFEGLSRSDGRNYSDMGLGAGLDNDFFDDTADGNNRIGSFPEPIVLRGNMDFTIRVRDTSGSTNTIEVAVVAVKEIPGNN